ncbi:hypothetical protein WR25_15930 [Diploscapter pachys]|uniref:C2H2-type domain-containing protein n=1 Tax=Diploscapter pachys TaxID=2018661 RepID=A0A2A2JMI8_9BILA|nr:hypothetical protein WR25_15930 [Diploscapter pachys]
MTDNASKARKMLEEAEKKSKGGGGFLGKLFGGGSGNSDVPDFYIKSESDDHGDVGSDSEGLNDYDDVGPSSSVIWCSAPRCSRQFESAVDFEQHLEISHNFHCAECGKVFYEENYLDVHAEENHSPMFAVLKERPGGSGIYACYDADCSQKFRMISKNVLVRTSEERNFHASETHGIRKVEAEFDRKRARKTDDNRGTLEMLTSKLEDVKFGDEQEKTFRPVLKAKRRSKH